MNTANIYDISWYSMSNAENVINSLKSNTKYNNLKPLKRNYINPYLHLGVLKIDKTPVAWIEVEEMPSGDEKKLSVDEKELFVHIHKFYSSRKGFGNYLIKNVIDYYKNFKDDYKKIEIDLEIQNINDSRNIDKLKKYYEKHGFKTNNNLKKNGTNGIFTAMTLKL